VRNWIDIHRWVQFLHVLRDIFYLDLEFFVQRLQLPIGKLRVRNNLHIVCIRSDFILNELFGMYL
jgi:hypothetical protein